MAKKDTGGTGDEFVDAALSKLTGPLPADEQPVDAELIDAEDDRDLAAIPDDLVFRTKPKSDAKDTDDDDEKNFLEIDLDGEILLAMRPSKGAWTILLAAMSRAANQDDRTHAIMNMVYSSFDAPSQMLISNRLMAPGDDFDIDVIADIVGTLIRKWAPAYSRKERRAAARANAR
jgi:hypothetical protein